MALKPGAACPTLLLAAAMHAIGAGSAGAWAPQAAFGYQADSEELISTWEGRAGLADMETPAGTFDAGAEFSRAAIDSNRFGLREVSDLHFGVLGGWKKQAGPFGLKAGAGLGSLDGWNDYTLSGEITRTWLPGAGWNLRAKGMADSRVLKANPLHAALGLRTVDARLSLGVSRSGWHAEAAAGMRRIAGASDAEVDVLLADTARVGAIPANRLLSAYLYGYRTFFGFFTAGAFGSWQDSRRDFYRFLHRSADRTDNYMYFPYDTPIDAWAAGGLLAVDIDLDRAALPLGTFSAKVTFPFFARRDQFYQMLAPNVPIPMYEGYYSLDGGEPWTAEAKVRKVLAGGTAVTLAYRFFLKPYLEYGYFDGQSYRMHAVEIRIGRG